MSSGCLNWNFNPLKWKSRVRPLTYNWQILIPTVGLSAMIATIFRAFSALYIHHNYTCKWVNLEGKCLIKRETPNFSFCCGQTVAQFDKPSIPLESSHQALKWVAVSFLFLWFDTSLGQIFPRRVTSPLLKIEFIHLQHLYLGHHFASIIFHARVNFRHE